MKTISKKQLILTLLKNDLRNARLVCGLNALGLDAGGYFLGLSTAVWQLMGYRREHIGEEQYALYQDLLERAKHMNDAENIHELEGLALEMYARLKYGAKMQESRAKMAGAA